MKEQITGVDLIFKERQKQIDKHGFTAEYQANHPEFYEDGQLLYAVRKLFDYDILGENILEPLNWDRDKFIKLCKKSRKERIIIAGALLAAELDRLIELEKK